MIRTSSITAGLALSAVLSACTVIHSALPSTTEEAPQNASEDVAQKAYRDVVNGTSRTASAAQCLEQAQREEALAFHPSYYETEGISEKASLQLHAARALAFYERADLLMAPSQTMERNRIRARKQVLQASLNLLAR